MMCSVWTTSNANTCFQMRTSEKQKDIITSHAYFCGKIPRAHISKGVEGYLNKEWMRIQTQLTTSMITKGVDGDSNTWYCCGKIPRAQISELSSTAAHIDDACSAAPQCSDGEVYVYARSCLPSQFCFGAWPDERSVMKKNKRLYNGDTYT